MQFVYMYESNQQYGNKTVFPVIGLLLRRLLYSPSLAFIK